VKGKDRQALREFTREDLSAKLRETEEKLFALRFRHASNPIKNPMELRHFKRDIARLKTILHRKGESA